MKGNDLYVANAGDSRCIICKAGQAIDMSVDHKPEDEQEYDRIVRAGGQVTRDGRVNGGLNLSRAIGKYAFYINVDVFPVGSNAILRKSKRRMSIDRMIVAIFVLHFSSFNPTYL